MADRTTATNVKATATNAKATATAKAKATTTAAAAKTSGTDTHVATTRTTHTTNARSGSKATAVIISKTTASPTPTIASASSGSSGAVIGGIAGGAVVLIAIVGLLFYKRRRRATVAVAAAKGGKGGDPETPVSPSGAISGPMSLAPDEGIKAPPSHRAEAQFREQQHFKPGMRDELFAQPTSPTHKNQTPMAYNSPPGTGNQGSINNKMNEKDGNCHLSPTESYEDTLVNDYFGGADAKESEAIGAQRPTPQARDVLRGNLTPAPEYYMGKEDIDPRRDLRGFDAPETYVKNSTVAPAANQGKPSDSPRSSCSSDRSSAYLTLEEAQQAHNNKMMGHKQSISSIDMLIGNQFPQASQGRTNQSPDHLLSVAMTESTMSMMPSLPPTSSPTALNGVRHQNGPYDARMQQQGSPLKGPNAGLISGVARVDPYAESAFSEDDRSVTSGSYYNPNYAQQKQQQLQMQQMQQQQQNPYSGGQSPPGYYPYSPQVLSPYQHSPTPYAQQFQGQQYQGQPYQGQQQQQGYNNNYNTNNNNNLNNRPQQPPQSGPGVQRDGPYGTYI
ncbi:hypothetical protein BGZ80_000750 [Entomortierella chlamydospora]|uniref:Uncharacterized protein n=1 Tax=Entomortierella chlamydospora TaxID=101097 RepID=A0A9P6MRZ8_9FUNG|nr:hypothetical protein BGZ80_000750 [Entomortierella chlamydospora]